MAGYLSEGEKSNPNIRTFETGIISPRVALFRKTDKICTVEKTNGDEEDESNSGIIVVTIILAILCLILAAVLAAVIMQERKGSPLFVPLVNDFSSAAKDNHQL